MSTGKPSTVTVMDHPLDTSELDARFTSFYARQERAEVTWRPGMEAYIGYGCRTNGRKCRFWVGKSTGWKPIYLMILTRKSTGGMAIPSSAVDSIRGLGVYR